LTHSPAGANVALDHMTIRMDVEGTLARWFAIDAIGQIGVFTGAYAAWPAAVFADYAIVDAADAFLDRELPAITDAIPTARYGECLRTRPPSPLWDAPETPDFALTEAAQGLFSFDADLGYGGATIYFLHARPRAPLLVEQANALIQRAARLVAFTKVRFSAVDQIDIAEHIEFVVGDR
jgi:hypothetical protein